MENNVGALMVGEGVTITGNIESDGTLYVYGNINGEVTAREIFVGETGKIVGSVKAELADIKGEIQNFLDVKNNLIIRSTGTVTGDINYESLEIERGGVIDGKLGKFSRRDNKKNVENAS